MNGNIPYFEHSFSGENLHFIAICDEKVVGLLCLGYQEDHWIGFENCQWAVLNVGVDPDYRNIGISKQLISNMFEFAEKNSISGICQSEYSDFSCSFLPKVFNDLSEKHKGVKFQDLNISF